MIALPRVVQHPSPNYTPVLIRHDLFVWHMTEGGYEGARAWLGDPRARASATGLLKASGEEFTQLVPASMKAWAQCAFNSAGCSLEIEGFTAHGLADVTVTAAATVSAWFCLAYDIPPVWAPGGQGRGLCCHHDLGAAGGDHHDICEVNGDLFRRLLAATQAIHADMAKGPLPAFALHGLPGPHEIAILPDAKPEPSHSGAPRCEADDTHAHPTPSHYPAHSIAALQDDLNRIFATQAPLEVDGRFGALTEAAVKRFQLASHLTDDGKPGPATWRALDAALAA